MFRPHTAILSCYRILSSRSSCSVMPIFSFRSCCSVMPIFSSRSCCSVMPIFFSPGGEYSITTDDGRVRPKHVLIEFKKWMCYIDGQKNKYSVLNECSRMLKYNILKLGCFHPVACTRSNSVALDENPEPDNLQYPLDYYMYCKETLKMHCAWSVDLRRANEAWGDGTLRI
jgi:hypothetical protein